MIFDLLVVNFLESKLFQPFAYVMMGPRGGKGGGLSKGNGTLINSRNLAFKNSWTNLAVSVRQLTGSSRESLNGVDRYLLTATTTSLQEGSFKFSRNKL